MMLVRIEQLTHGPDGVPFTVSFLQYRRVSRENWLSIALEYAAQYDIVSAACEYGCYVGGLLRPDEYIKEM